MKMGSPANEDGEKAESEGHRRGIMVIKACNKTKAKQRKGAVNHWKVICEYMQFLLLNLLPGN